MWWKFKRHRVAVVSGIILLLMYASILVTEILVAVQPAYAAHRLHLRPAAERAPVPRGPASSGPFVYALDTRPSTWRRCAGCTPRTRPRAYPLRFFCSGDPYEFWGLVEMSFHLVCPAGGRDAVPARHRPPGPRRAVAHLLRRADLAHHRPARHRRSASRSGSSSAALAGYYGGWVDIIVQRVIEIIRSFPELPLWMALVGRAAGDVEPDPRLLRHHGHPRRCSTGPGLARAVRSKLLALREEDYTHRRAADGREPAADHRPPPAARIHEPPHRLGDAVDPGDDPGRDGAVVSSASACGRRSPAGACC